METSLNRPRFLVSSVTIAVVGILGLYGVRAVSGVLPAAKRLALPAPAVGCTLASKIFEEVAVFCAGCAVWGTQAFFRTRYGRQKSQAGYCGGTVEHPILQARLYRFDRTRGRVRSFTYLFAHHLPRPALDGFLLAVAHDPTPKNRQGPRYRICQ